MIWMLGLVAAGLLGQQVTSIGTPHVYKTVDGRDWKLYVVSPSGWKAGDKRPAIVFFHGGGWKGEKATQFNAHSEYLASRGMVAIQVEYRPVVGDKDLPITCIQDSKSAMRWVRAHAKELGVDPKRVAAGGGSAGGHLATYLGLMDGFDDPADDRKISAKPNALVLYNPVFDNSKDGWGNERVGERYLEFSPFHHVKKGAPPAVVFVGSDDTLIRPKTVLEFQARMKKVGAKCEAYVYEGQKHGFFNYRAEGNRFYTETVRKTDEFLRGLGWIEGPPSL